MKHWSGCWWSLDWEAFDVHETSDRTVDDLPSEWEVTRMAQRLRVMLPRVRARYRVGSIALFGSYVRNQQRPDSDLDLLVSCNGPLGLFEEVNLCDELTSGLGVRVHIARREGLQARIARYILREALEL